MRFKIRISISWILIQLISTSCLFAQEPTYNVYDEDNGLPSNQVFGLVLTNNNELWATTDRGVVRFDGYEFKTFTLADGLIENCALRIFNSTSGEKIWVTSVINTINSIENNNVSTPGFNKVLSRIPTTNSQYVQQLFFDGDSLTSLCLNKPGLYVIDGDTMYVNKKSEQDTLSPYDLCVNYLSGTDFFWYQIKAPSRKYSGPVQFKSEGNSFYFKTSTLGNSQSYRKSLAPVGPDEFYFSYVNWIFHVKKGKLIKSQQYDKEILTLKYDKGTKDLWVGLMSLGAWRYLQADFIGEPIKYLEGKSVADILIDHERNYWFATNFSGLFQANSLELEVYRPSVYDENITALCEHGDDLFFGTQKGSVFKINKSRNNKYELEQINIPEVPGKVRRINPTVNGSLIVFKDSLLEIGLDGKLTGFEKKGWYPYDYLSLADDRFLMSFSSSIRLYHGQKIIHDYNNHDGFKSVRQFFRSGKGEFWLSSNHIGTVLWTDTLSSPQNLIDIDSLFQFRSLDIEQTGDLLWFSITGRGLLVYHQDMDTTFHLTMQSHGLSSDIIDILFAENDSVIWAGSNTGLDRIIIRPDTLLDFKSFNYTTKTGLPSNKIHDIRLFDEHIWVATKKGLVKLLPNFDLENKDNIPSHISQIIVDSKPYHPDSLPTILEAGTHTIEFVMRALSYHIPHNVHYRYKMDNVDEDWTITQKQSVLYRELGQGNYNFQFHASYHSNRFPENTVSLEFKIQKYFHETLAFLIIMTIVILAIIMLIVLWIIQALRRQEQNKQKLLLAEKKALLSQMNPHFIFNSLNSIQHYIIQQDEENANLYLSKFAALIRRILDNSKKKFISLAEEIDTLELYLYLEKLRFEEKFNFSVSKSDDLDNHMVLVPPMIIQPFVENAIWHGLTPLKSGGLLTITFRKTNTRMKVVIEDNGIGRTNAARAKRPPGHESTGLRNVQERLALLNKMIIQPIFCEIIDLRNEEGHSAGTRVIISIPLNLQHE